ncbi:pyridoxal-phosphate dependent enzyme [Stygiolobus caldivivus]|uniref:Threonine synthase n=1 Tax=Stygiolobus caldivivus TaxID=2824673 RepID=A0A8D5U4R9_9CREN|nr:pyridoxal-phosphate dependent enzyme [Stygiolobus caldivivus]BCU68934.1 threonine synthase [Stygiolobus caldivivus]
MEFTVKCSRCGRERENIYEITCPRCGGPFKVEIMGDYTPEVRENFPYLREWVSLGEGNTPLLKVGKLRFKLDFLNPTGSYKDRGSVTLISYLKQVGIKDISEDSSGNAGASISAYSAAAGINATIFVPENAKGSKLRQIESYGAKVVKVKGSRDDVMKAAMGSGKYYASHILQPFFRDGIRTLAYEIISQYKDTREIVIPVSAGTLLLGLYEGLTHLLRSGIIEEKPKIIAVQTEQVMPLCASFHKIPYTPPEKVDSIADALVSTQPVLLPEMMKAIDECVVVKEEEILRSWKDLARMGLLVEYSSATVLAGSEKVDLQDPVLVLTGSGLKTF